MNSQINELRKLVQRFKVDEIKFVSSSYIYHETEVRVEFIDPFFRLLGWHMDNSEGLPSRLRDVLREEPNKTKTSIKKPDYTFRIATVRKFFVEAKCPSIDIRINKESALQIRRYGYTAGLPISILTNFRTLRIYDTRLEPQSTDDVDVALLESIDYEDYPSKFEKIIAKFGRDQVALGSIERIFKVKTIGINPANASFLDRINKWRVQIAQDLHSRYPKLTIEELSDFTQKIINRIIFIRMCEDRGIEGEEVLRKTARKKNVIELRNLFRQMDSRYNTGLFDVSKDRLQDSCEIDAIIFLQIVDEVYIPNSPYSFSVLDADFLGQIYELFLGQYLIIDSTDKVKLELKPTCKNREIITTPQPIVNEVVRRVFESKFSQLQTTNLFTLDSIKSIRIFDVAVGSGRFLLRAFDEMINAVIQVLHDSKEESLLYRITDNNYRLDFQIKKKILEECFFGIDIDYNAVEIARFSLMVRLLEDETNQTLPDGSKILPDLDLNIIHGNTIVETNFPFTSEPVFDKTIPLNWNLSNLPVYFDIVIGNPPYLKTEDMKENSQDEFEYYKRQYKTAYKQFDKYFIFVELALSKMNDNAWLGMVIPNKWITIEAGKKFRELLSKDSLVSQIVDFGNEHIFENKSAYTCILVLTKQGTDSFFYRHVNNYQEFLLTPQEKGFVLPEKLVKNVGKSAWVLPSNSQEAFILGKITANSIPMSQLVDIKNGIQTSANKIFIITKFKERGAFVEFTQNGILWKIEKAITRPYINNSIDIVTYNPIHADAIIIFPYKSSINNAPVIIEPEIMEQDFPMTMAYLKEHKKRLNVRKVSPPQRSGVFYAYGRHQSLDIVFSAPKIIYSVNQKGDKYAIDFNGIAYASGGTAGEVAILNPRNGFSIEFFLGLLNQRVIELFARKRGSPFGDGWYARGSAVMEDVPVPNLDIVRNYEHKVTHDLIVNDVTTLIEIQRQKQTASKRNLELLTRKYNSMVNSLELRFNVLWGFTGEAQSLVLPGESVD